MNDLGVFLWGPKGSGKTSLAYSFCYCIQHNYTKGYKGLQFNLNYMDGSNAIIHPPDQIEGIKMGTQEMQQFNWMFERTSIEVADDRENEYSHKISCKVHHLFFFDSPGGQLDQLIDPKNSDEEIKGLRLKIVGASNIIILLDPSLLVKTHNQNLLSDDQQRARITQPEYTTKIINLLELLNQGKQVKRRIAVCLTKADLIDKGMVDQAQMAEKDSWNLIEMKFGSEMVYSIRKNNKQNEIRPFVLSAKKEKVNEWKPDGIEWPLFWLFESSEKEKITEVPPKDLLTRIFAKERLKYYIPYPKPSWTKNIKKYDV